MNLSQAIQEKIEHYTMMKSYRLVSEIIELVDENRESFPTDFVSVSECPNKNIGFFEKDWPVSSEPQDMYPPVPFIHIVERNESWYRQCLCCDGRGKVTHTLTVGELSDLLKRILALPWWNLVWFLFTHKLTGYSGIRCNRWYMESCSFGEVCSYPHTILLSIRKN